MNLADVVREIQEQAGLNQSKFADLLYVSPSTITHYYDGSREPNRGVIGRLLRVAEPEQQAKLLVAIGATDDVEQFAFDLLAAANVRLVCKGTDGSVTEHGAEGGDGDGSGR